MAATLRTATAWLLVSLAMLAGTLLSRAAQATNYLAWHTKQERVDADIQSLDLTELLQNLANDTGWQVFVQPGITQNVSTKFQDLPTGEALRSLLGDLNYAVIPSTNSSGRRLYVFRTTQREATQMVRPPPKAAAKAIPNELIVTLKPGSKVKIDDLAKALGAKVIGRMDAQNAYRLQFDDAAAAQSARAELAANPDVAQVDSNFPVEAPPKVEVAAAGGATAPDLQLNPQTNSGPCQLVIGLIDTPTQPLGANLDVFIKPSISVSGVSSTPPDPAQLTHGTAMEQAILQMLKQKTGGSTSVKIQPVNVYGNSETTTTFDVANGIVQAVNSGANLINLSLGSTGDSQFLHDTITQVAQRGIPLYAAAGNTPVTTPTYPAAYSEVIAVTASDPTGKIADYANRGSFVDMMAPGTDVVNYGGQSFVVQGTSTATAFVTGMAAGLADTSHACADQAQMLLKNSLKPPTK